MLEKGIADGILSLNVLNSDSSMMAIFGQNNGAKIIKVKQLGGKDLWTSPYPLYVDIHSINAFFE